MLRLVLPSLLFALLLGPVHAQSTPLPTQAPSASTTRTESALDRVLNSVVSISTAQPSGTAGPSSRGWSPFPGALLPWLGTGTGVLLSEREVLTSARLVQGNARVTVTTRSGEAVPAIVVGLHAERDVALLRLERRPSGALRPAQLGNSARVTSGQKLIAVGLSPSGGFTAQEVTVRNAAASDEFTIDTALNATIRGGPLVNTSGEVVGLVSGRFGSRLNVAFPSGAQGAAVPINAATASLTELRAGMQQPFTAGVTPSVSSPVRLGVRVVDLTQVTAEQRRRMNLPARGLLVEEVISGSPADQAGVQASLKPQGASEASLNGGGDVIVAVDGRSIQHFEEFQQTIARKEIGSTVTLEVLRGGQSQRFTVRLDRSTSQ
ncbi:serine protease, S1-C subfamily, contains C-terminal PDZ domain [Deinococcus hopiensis KR-140]|uniref:Serine protease, S1-C subfamily, contains C-terminal PDZ domain n=2 Tax=Deinococcus TaxID=1298 RepID=A0A1W1UWT3_9DEIO|nr:trypsin-like peptidase domain-containing protein [Deinococcus hopiensis]SMB85459.1 serine protease, S1-C subfamily, contains C-terminal PDZ domain [Deinococcus hopiensis KR-140]